MLDKRAHLIAVAAQAPRYFYASRTISLVAKMCSTFTPIPDAA
jgi:hypothetical protein